jgi:hypothetical protein
VAWYQGKVVEAVSREDGLFVIRGLPSSPLLLRLDAPGFARGHREIYPKQEQSLVEIGLLELVEGGTVELFGDREGAGLTARVDLRNERLDLDFMIGRIDQGKAIFRHVSTGEATVSIWQDKALICEESVQIHDREIVRIECGDERLNVRGEVWESGQVVGPGTLLWSQASQQGNQSFFARETTPEGLTRTFEASNSLPEVAVTVDPSGAFSTDSLRAGIYEVSWEPRARVWIEPRQIEIRRDAEEQFLILDFSTASIGGWVLGQDGEGVAGARVEDVGGNALTWSEKDGSFVLRVLESGVHAVQARHQGRESSKIQVDVGTNAMSVPLKLVLREPERQEARIAVQGRSGEARPGATVFLELDNGSHQVGTADQAGVAVFELKTPLPQRVRAASVTKGGWILSGWSTLEEVSEALVLDLGESGAVEVTSEQPSGPLQIYSEDGWDLSWLVAQWTHIRPQARHGAPFRLYGMPIGRYRLESASETQDFRIEAGESSIVELRDFAREGSADVY